MTVDPVAVQPPRGAMPVVGPSVGTVDDLVKVVWLLAAANFGVVHVTLQLPVQPPRRAVLVSSTDPDRIGGEVDPDRFVLLPSEVVVLATPLDAHAASGARFRGARA